jgi:uncharacterized protein VirK/YbjX
MTVIVNSPMTADDNRRTTALGLFFSALTSFVSQNRVWPLARLAGTLWRALNNIGTDREVFRFLKLSTLGDIVPHNPRFALKYLTRNYLAKDLTVVERASCFIHHYTRLRALLPNSIFCQTLRGDVTLHEIYECGHRFALTMGLSRPCDKEGEMSLNLLVDDEIVFLLSFTIVPGWVVKSEAAETLLISRIQGIKGCFHQIHFATKALHDVAPSALLLAVLQGVADAFRIGEIVAVCANRQNSYTEELASAFKSAYDDFFEELGMAKNAAGFYFSPTPIEDKPLALIKRGHKLRTKEKRAFKQRIRSASVGFFDKFVPVSAVAVRMTFTGRPPHAQIPCKRAYALGSYEG